MGSPDVRAYSRNKRGVAGSLIWINFDRHALLSVFHKARGRFLANKDDIRPQFRMDSQSALDQTAIFNSALVRTSGLGVGSTIDQLDNLSLSEVSGFKELAAPWFRRLKLGPPILPDTTSRACRGLETSGRRGSSRRGSPGR